MVWLSPSIQIITRCSGNFPTLCVYTVASNDEYLRGPENKCEMFWETLGHAKIEAIFCSNNPDFVTRLVLSAVAFKGS